MRNSGASWGTILLLFSLTVFLMVGLSVLSGWPPVLYTAPSLAPIPSQDASISPTPFIIPTPTPFPSASPKATLHLIPAVTLPPAGPGGANGSANDANFFLRLFTGVVALFSIGVIVFLALRIRRRTRRVFTFSKGMQSAKIDEKARATMIAAALSQNQRDTAIREPGWTPAWRQNLPKEELAAIIPPAEAAKTPKGSRLRLPALEKRTWLRIVLGGVVVLLASPILLKIYNASFKGLWEKLTLVDQLAFLFLLVMVIGSAGGLEILMGRNRLRTKQQEEFLAREKIAQEQAAEYASAEFSDIIDFTPPPLLYLPPRLTEKEPPPVAFFEPKALHAKEPFWIRFLRPLLFWRQANKFTGLSSSSPLPESPGPALPYGLDFEESAEPVEKQVAPREPVLDLPLVIKPRVSWAVRLSGWRAALTPLVKKTVDSIYALIFLLVTSFVVAYIFEIILVFPLIFNLTLIFVWLITHRQALFAKPPVIEQPVAETSPVAAESSLELPSPVIFDPVSLTMKPLEVKPETLSVVKKPQMPPVPLSNPRPSLRLPLLIGGALTVLLLSLVAFVSLGTPANPNTSGSPSLIAVVSPSPTSSLPIIPPPSSVLTPNPTPTPTSAPTFTPTPTPIPTLEITPTSVATLPPVINNTTGGNNLMLNLLGLVALLLICLALFALWIWKRSWRLGTSVKVPPLVAPSPLEDVTATVAPEATMTTPISAADAGATALPSLAEGVSTTAAPALVEGLSPTVANEEDAQIPKGAPRRLSQYLAIFAHWIQERLHQIRLPARTSSPPSSPLEEDAQTSKGKPRRPTLRLTLFTHWIQEHLPQIRFPARTSLPRRPSHRLVLGGLTILLVVLTAGLVANWLPSGKPNSSSSPSLIALGSPSATPVNTSSPIITLRPSPTLTPTLTPTPRPTPTFTPTTTPIATPTMTPTASPTVTPASGNTKGENNSLLLVLVLLVLILAGAGFWFWSLKRRAQSAIPNIPEGVTIAAEPSEVASSTAQPEAALTAVAVETPATTSPAVSLATGTPTLANKKVNRSRRWALGAGLSLILIFIGATIFYILPKSPVSPSASPSLIAAVSPTPTPSTIPSPTPLIIPSPTPLITPSPSPSLTSSPSPSPTLTPSPGPTSTAIPTDLYTARRSALPPCTDRANCYVYTVKAGDTLSGIAQYFGISLTDLLAFNPPFTDVNLILVGQKIYIPA